MHPAPISDPGLIAADAFAKGHFLRAVRVQVDAVNRLIQAGQSAFDAKKILGRYLVEYGDLESARALFETLCSEVPQAPEVWEARGDVLRRMGDYDGAIAVWLQAHELAPDRTEICDELALAFGVVGETENCKRFGIHSLELKDDEAAESPFCWEVPSFPPEPWDPNEARQNIIGFSLWGDEPRFISGAIRNAEAAARIYPGWTCRFYCDDSVPPNVRSHLLDLGAQVRMMNEAGRSLDGRFWRLLVINDESVKRFQIRDCDSILNAREQAAVEEWLLSGWYFHVMRDFVSHSQVIVGGLWGGVGGVLPPLETLLEHFNPAGASDGGDLRFLRQMVWPTIRQSALSHDSVFTGSLGSRPFPGIRPNWNGGFSEENSSGMIEGRAA